MSTTMSESPFNLESYTRKYGGKPFSLEAYTRKYGSNKKGNKINVQPSQEVKKYIKREISRNTENKKKEYYSDSRVDILPVDNASFAASIEPISPFASRLAIDQGPGQGQRIGNKIKIKSIKFRGTILPNPHNATTHPTPAPAHVAIWIFYDRTDPNAIPSPKSDFFQHGNSVQAMQGDLQDLTSPVNKDKYRVLTKRIFKVGNAEYPGTGVSNDNQRFANNDFKLNQTFNIDVTKYVVKNVKYNDNNTTPTTRGLYFMIVPYNAYGSIYSSTTLPMSFFYNLQMSYEDA